MRKLSTILDSNDVYVNNKGYMWFRVGGKSHVRKIQAKPFSNFAIVTVRYNNDIYLVDDSRVNNVSMDEYFNL